MLRRALLAVSLVLLAAACAEADVGRGAGSSGDRGASGATSRWVDDPDCDEATIGDDGDTLVAAFAVRDGTVRGRCAGEADPRLDAAWDELIDVVPAERLGDLVVFGGFDDPDSDVLAFATMVGDSNDRFAIVVNLALAESEPQELRLTLAHELSHVFTQTPDQMDVDVDPASCPTFHNGNGCFLEGSLLLEWIDRFWTEDQLAALPDPTGSGDGTDDAGADRRCSSDPGFPGVYAASSPEEDLAESFSAFALGVDVPPSVQPRVDFFAGRPEFEAFRRAAGTPSGSPGGAFDECGV